MKIEHFVDAQALWAKAESSTVSVIVSDLNNDGEIKESTFEKQCEWRQPYRSSVAEPIDRPADCTWAAIAEHEDQAKKDYKEYSN